MSSNFACAKCNCILLNKLYYKVNRKDYCQDCYDKNFLPKCFMCEHPCKGGAVVELGKHWHPKCFRCEYCDKPLLENASALEGVYYEVQGMPYHYNCHFLRRWELQQNSDDE